MTVTEQSLAIPTRVADDADSGAALGRFPELPDLAFMGFLTAAIVALLLYAHVDPQSPWYDLGGHFVDGVRLLHTPLNSRMFAETPLYPFFVSVVALPFNLLGDSDYQITMPGVEAVFTCVLLTSTYGCGRRLFGGWAGLLAAALLAAYPAVVGQSHIYMLDVPLAAMVALSYWLLLLSDGLRRQGYALGLGIAMGLGMLTKFSFVFFVAPPLAVAAAGAAASAAPYVPERLGRAHLMRLVRCAYGGGSAEGAGDAAFTGALLALTATLLALLWYAPRLSWLRTGYQDAVTSSHLGRGEGSGLSYESVTYYVSGLWHTVSFAFAIVFVADAALYFLRGHRGRLLLGTWLAVGYICLTLAGGKEPRYMLPALPAVALVSAAGLGVPGPRVRAASVLVATGLVGFGALQVWAVVAGIGWLPNGPFVRDAPAPHEPVAFFSQRQGYVQRPAEESWSVDPAVRWLRADARASGLGTYRALALGAVGRNSGGSGPGAQCDRAPAGFSAFQSSFQYALDRTTLVGEQPSGAPGLPADYLVCAVPAQEPLADRVVLSFLPALSFEKAHEEALGVPALSTRLVIYRRGP